MAQDACGEIPWCGFGAGRPVTLFDYGVSERKRMGAWVPMLFSVKDRKPDDGATNDFKRRVRRKKALLYASLVLASAIVAIASIRIFVHSLEERLNPQIQGATVQIAQAIPWLQQNEEALDAVFDQMSTSWKRVASSGATGLSLDTEEARQEYRQLLGETLSWMNQVTKLKVGSAGYVMVLDKATGSVLAHPDPRYVQRSYVPAKSFTLEGALAADDVRRSTAPSDVEVNFLVVVPAELQDWSLANLHDTGELLLSGLFGCAIDNGDTYIVCGVPLIELAAYVANNVVMFLAFFVMLMWLLVKWIGLTMEAHQETVRTLLPKLILYATIVCALLLVVSWYTQTLSDVTGTLRTLSKDADAGVETLTAYEEQQGKINGWLDEFYTEECRVASQIVTTAGRENLTRQNLQRYADDLDVKAIYVFDQDGKVVVTNSPYDHFRLGDDPDDLTYGLRPLLDGTESVLLEPAKDEWYDEEVQYVGVSTRNEQDLCDGFVMIAVDPTLREELLAPLEPTSVVSSMAIGLPDEALAINKESQLIVVTTGLGFTGEPLETLGLTVEDLTEDFSGFLTINNVKYYAGISESSELFLVPLARRTTHVDAFFNALRLTAFAAVYTLIVMLLTLLGFKKTMDAAPEAAEPEDAPQVAESLDDGDEAWDLFSGFTNLVKTQKKFGFDERWDVDRVPKEQMTPDQRIVRIVYRLLLLFCLFVLLPTLYFGLTRNLADTEMGNIAYVIFGNWQRGLNIFAVTSCIFLLCAMYVGVVLLNRILFGIAKVSDTRVETVCLLVKNSAKYVCAVVFVYYGLSRFGVDTQTLLASAGILSMMISFGAKDLVADIIAGFFTIFEGTYRVGDFVNVGGWFGTVVEIGLRTTKVRNYADTKIFNNSSLRDVVNSDGEVARVKVKVPVAYDTDLVTLRTMLEEELPQIAERIPGVRRGPRYDGVDELGESGVLLRFTVYVTGYMRGKAQRALTEELKLLLDRKGVEIPFNQIVVREPE